MAINIKEKIGKNKIVILVIPNEKYAESIVEIARSLASDYKKICYVNLNRPYSTLINIFESQDIDSNRFFFIDGVTKKTDEAKKVHNCLYVDAPNALTQLSLGINKLFKTLKPEILLFDSISTILIYEKASTVTKFMHHLIGKIRSIDCIAIFTALEEGTISDLMKDLHMFTDKTICLK